jgi:hypothetical protein
MRRRSLILCLFAIAAMGTAHAQQSGKAYRIAVVYPATDPRAGWFTETTRDPLPFGFFSELHRLGYFEGKNILIERYSGEGQAPSHQHQHRESTGSHRAA